MSSQKTALNLALVVLAIFSIALLLGSDYYKVYAQTATNSDFTLQTPANEIFYMEATGKYILMAKVANGTSTRITVIPAGTTEPESYISTSFTISPQFGGCTHATDTFNSNPCSTVASANCNPNTFGDECVSANKYGSFQGLWCGLTDCFTTFNALDGTYSNQLLRIAIEGDSVNEVTGYMNFTDNDFLGTLAGVDIGSVGIGGISVFALACSGSCSTSEVATLYKIGGTSLMGSVGSITANQIAIGDNTSAQGWGITNLDICWFCGGDTNVKRIFIAGKQGATTNRAITVINAETMTEVCGHTNNGLGSGSSQNTGHIRYLGDTKNQLAYITDTNIVRLNLSCAKQQDVAYATLGLSNYPKSIAVDDEEQAYYILHGSAGTTASIKKANLTSFNTALNFDSLVGSSISGWVSASTMYDSMAYSPVSKTIIYNSIPDAKTRMLFLSNFTGGEGSEGEAGEEICFVIEGTGQQVCYPTDENGNPIVGSVTEIVATQNPLVNVVGQYMCQVGIQTDCTDGLPTNTDVKTNGVGFILWFLSWAIFSAIIGAALYGHVKMVENIMVIFTVLLIATAFSIAMQWVDEMYLYVIIFTVIGLASVGVTKFVMGHGRGGGGGAE